MIYPDNQTGHLYVVSSPNNVSVHRTVDHKFRFVFHNGSKNVTSDVIDDRLILRVKANPIKPIYYRKWVVYAPTSVSEGTTYYLYFYLENMIGFGIQDRWDRVASYTAKTNDTAAAIMTALKDDLDLKLNAAGPIKDDFVVTLDGSNNIVVKENPASDTYKFDRNDVMLHGVPYAYNVTMSTFDGTGVWGGDANKEIRANNDTNIRISSGMKVYDMEHYFLRNRADKYDLTKPFGVSIINDVTADVNKHYSMVNIHYAFSDEQGYSYRSEKDLNIAVEEPSEGSTVCAEALVHNINNGFVNVGLINDEASWKANYNMLRDYFDGGNTDNKDAWNSDGWLIFNMPKGVYNGKTLAPTYNGVAAATVNIRDTTTYAIYSVTSSADMNEGKVSNPADFDITKLTYTIS